MDLGLLILRVAGGIIMIAHGIPKWPKRGTVAQNWAKGGMPNSDVAVIVAYVIEVPIGIMYVAGLLTGWVSVVMLLFMLPVTWWSIRVGRERLVSFGAKGYDVNLALLALFLATALAGGGAYSLDRLLGVPPYWPVR